MSAETKNVFVDTQVFDQHHLDVFNSPLFKRLTQLAASDELRLVLTDVTAREIRRHLDDAARKAVKQASNFSRLHRVTKRLVNEEDLERVKGITGDSFSVDLLNEFEQFLKATKAIVLPIDDVRPSEVFERYYEKRAPFGPNGKKSEFPDAFAAMALEKWCKDGDPPQKVYIISDDGDWRRVCDDTPEFVRVKLLSELLELFASLTLVASSETQPEVEPEPAVDLDAIREAVRAASGDVLATLRKTIERADIYFYPDDSVIDGDIEDVEVESAELDDVHVIAAMNGSAVVGVSCKVTVSMSVSGDDPESQWRDDDDGSMHSVWSVKGSITRDFTIEGSVEVAYELDDPRDDTVYDATFHPQGIDVAVEEGELSRDDEYDDIENEVDPMLPDDEFDDDEDRPF